MPKGFLPMEGKTLIERSIEALTINGIEQIIIGTGYLSESYHELKEHFPQLVFGQNPDFATTGSMYTLHGLRELITTDFLLLESDLLYERMAISALQESAEKTVVLGSGKTHSGDEVYIQTNAKGQVLKMSKKPAELQSLDAELVGITKIDLGTFKKMLAFAEKNFAENPKLDYEYTLVGVSLDQPIKVLKIEDLIWCEIDDENHLQRALTHIWPKIKSKDFAL